MGLSNVSGRTPAPFQVYLEGLTNTTNVGRPPIEPIVDSNIQINQTKRSPRFLRLQSRGALQLLHVELLGEFSQLLGRTSHLSVGGPGADDEEVRNRRASAQIHHRHVFAFVIVSRPSQLNGELFGGNGSHNGLL